MRDRRPRRDAARAARGGALVSGQPSLFDESIAPGEPAPPEQPVRTHSPAPWTAEPTYYTAGTGERTPTGYYVVAADGTPVCSIEGVDDTVEADLSLILAAPRLYGALKALLSSKHVSLGDLVYQVREREGLGWEGPAVKAWSDAVVEAEAALAACVPPGGAQ
jgi:hypothetical protein